MKGMKDKRGEIKEGNVFHVSDERQKEELFDDSIHVWVLRIPNVNFTNKNEYDQYVEK